MLQDTIKTLQGHLLADKSNRSDSSNDMMNMALQIATMISKQADPTPYMQMISKLNETVAGLQMERLQDQIASLKASQNPTPQQVASQNLSTMIDEFRKIQDLIGGGEPREARMPWWAGMIQSIAAPAAQIVTNITSAFMASRMPPGMTGMPMQAPMPPMQPQPGFPGPVGPMPAEPQPMQAQPAMTPMGPQFRDPRFGYPADGQPMQAQPQPQGPDELMVILVGVQGPLVGMLQEDKGGDDFADWFIGGYKERVYEELMQRADQVAGQMGAPRHAAILALLDSFPPLAQQLHQFPRSKVEQFAKEFSAFDGDAYDIKMERERNREEQEAERA
jgi:hypothetical protein